MLSAVFYSLSLRLVPALLCLGLCIVSATRVFSVEVTKEQVFQLATLAARDGEYERAADFFRKAIEMDPRFAPAYNGLGLVYESWDEGGGLKEATRYFKLATEVDPQHAECWNNLGRAYYSQGHFSAAEKAFLTSLTLKPDQPDIELALAWVYLLGESMAEEAITHFQKGLAGQDNDMAHYGLGLAHLLQGDKFRVMDQITQLRRRQREEQAVKLETMIREGVQISSKPGSPLVAGKDLGESLFDQELSAIAGGAFDADQKAQGIQVRLKGPLR